ncbi:DUF4160 domain-containing protein [Geotoga petraea]|uniref:DUF4160 domain-containing protein n=1 Tax=Geotoga petraea TaxID=28234 RepID=A0A1G6L120_9BACT|nr:DUF4160 domain-containing protein [Geotoga petraea]MDK2946788.1 hypothetical protein [Geotoga sp.]TGG88799.1 DUF4160 domain-containing protein [Geotoga petraea]SDC36758.1 protein of unknown function [Geotoga petraea]
MPTICMFRGIKIYINYRDHLPPHFHCEYGEFNCIISIEDIEIINGDMPNKQLKMIYGWAALHQEELNEEWYLAQQQKELFPIDPLK